MPAISVRRATLEDAPACARIYAHYVENTATSFETEAPSVEEFTERMRKVLATHDWLVADEEGTVIGFAYAGPFHHRAAYQWSIETTIYLAPQAPGRGVGRMLYTELLKRMTERGFTSAIALIAKPNEASEALHRSFGYEPVGTFRSIGYKNGQWRDVCWWQKMLAPTTGEPDAPAPPA